MSRDAQTVVQAPAVRATRISRRYGPTLALREVSLDVERGSVHALVGENGAGKSTLGKILAGVEQPTSGQIEIAGAPVSLGTPRRALELGVAMMAQELTLVPRLSVMQNVFLGREPRVGRTVLQSRRLREEYDRLLERTGFELDGDRPVSRLRVAERQTVEILRALARNVDVIIMDEPTAALDRHLAVHLFDTIHALRARGVSIVYVSHYIGEVLDLADTITVMRDGVVVSTRPRSEHTSKSLINEMLGADLDVTFPAKQYPPEDSPVRLEVTGLNQPPMVSDVSFKVRAGEIVALAGLVGSGRSETAHVIFGSARGSGEVRLNGERLTRRTPKRAIDRGLGLLPESRKDQGLFLDRSISENIGIASMGRRPNRLGVPRRREERARVEAALNAVGIHRDPEMRVRQLSGGNQQRVLFGRWLQQPPPRVLIVDEPTRGVDIGAKRAIYEIIGTMAASGVALLIISSEVEELLGLAHRVVVLRSGSVAAELDGREVTEADILEAEFGSRAAGSDGVGGDAP